MRFSVLKHYSLWLALVLKIILINSSLNITIHCHNHYNNFHPNYRNNFQHNYLSLEQGHRWRHPLYTFLKRIQILKKLQKVDNDSNCSVLCPDALIFTFEHLLVLLYFRLQHNVWSTQKVKPVWIINEIRIPRPCLDSRDKDVKAIVIRIFRVSSSLIALTKIQMKKQVLFY